jgi:hypothetical protein
VLTLVDAGQSAAGDRRWREGEEEDAGSGSFQLRSLNGAVRFPGQGEDLEGVAVWSVAFDGFGAVVSAADRGSQDLYASGGLVRR